MPTRSPSSAPAPCATASASSSGCASQARQQDYRIAAGQLDASLVGVATALRGRHGVCKAALGLTLQTSLWPVERIVERLVPQLLDTVQTVRPIL